jgi:peroxiredoxin
VPDDVFGDLGPDPPKRSAAERFEEEDRVNPEPDMPPPQAPRRATNRYAWLVGVIMLMGIGVLLLTTALPNTGAGLNGPPHGGLLPAFAAPLATSNIDGDANVRQSRSQGNDQAGKVPACRVISRDVLNSCQLRERPSVITFLVTKGADCEPQVDRVERMKSEFPNVDFAVVVSGDGRKDVGQIAKNRRWTQPVGVDRDGAVVNLYGIGVCPSTVFSYAGGEVRTTKLGNLTEDELRAATHVVANARRLPDFAAPLATGKVRGDANVRQAGPGDARAGRIPACKVRGAGILNSCDLRRRASVTTFIAGKGADCTRQVDRVERLRRRFRRVNFATVVSGEDRAAVAKLVARRGWTQPVGVDTDGAVVNLARVGGCPTTVFAYPGGRLRATRPGNLTRRQLSAQVRALER